uniref:ATP-binding cassette domain-containing protein n=1 Tax=Escherichia coli TaxID=562 RepID=UPI003AEF9264
MATQFFSNLTYTFSQPITALIGRNGVGKSLLAQIMAGRLLPTEGSCINRDLVYYLSQKKPMKIVPKPLLKHWGFSLYWMHYNALKMVVLILMILKLWVRVGAFRMRL